MIRITSVKFNNEFRPAQDLTYLLSCIDERVSVAVNFSYEDIAYRTEDNLITLKPDASEVDLADSTGVILSEDGNAFENTFIGDTIGVSQGGVSIYYTVTEKFNNGMIRTTYAGVNKEMDQDDFVFNSTPFNGLRYAYNLIDSGNSYNSLVDGEYQQLVTASMDCTNVVPAALNFTGIRSYQIGSATIVGTGGTGGTGGTLGTFITQSFKLVHNTVVTPLFLASEYADLLLGIKPDRFKNSTCPNYIAKIQLGRNLTDPNNLQELEVASALSNIGWYGERFNGGATNYFLSSLVIKKGATIINALELGDDITVEATVDNVTDAPFSTGNTKYIFGFKFLPSDEDQYQNNGRDLEDNFVFDSKINTLGSGSVNGNNFGTGMQVIKNVTSTYISATQMKVTATIRVGTDARSIITEGDFNRYQMFLMTENHANTAVTSDKINLSLQVSEFELNLTNSDLIVSGGANFIMHPYDDYLGAINGNSLNVYPVDDIVANLNFYIDFTDISDGSIKIKKVQSKFLLKDGNDVESDITLEDFSFSTEAYPIVGGRAQAIDFESDRIFKIPQEIRKTITCERDYSNDVGYVLFYQYMYPFMQRWEYWQALLGVTAPPSGIFDNTKPLNGLNHFWYRFTTVTDWHLWYDVIFTIEQNGIEFTQTFSKQLNDSNDYDSNPEWDNNSIKSYDIVTDTEIENAGIQYIKGSEDVKIVASFEKVSGGMPDISNVGIVIWIETFESGGEPDIRRISSFRVLDSQSWFKSVDTSDKVIVANPSPGVYAGTCLLDYTKLPANSDYTLYARIYNNTNSLAKQFEDGDDFTFEDDEIYEFEDAIVGVSALNGVAIKQDFRIIRNGPAKSLSPSDILTPISASGECCVTSLIALAEDISTSPFYNDSHGFTFDWNNNFVSATMFLQKFTDGAWADSVELTDNTYGTMYDFGHYFTNYDENKIGYLIDWALVKGAFGEGNYRVKSIGTTMTATTVDKFSLEFELMAYTADRADRSVRVEWWLNGNLGDQTNDLIKRDFGTLNWYNQVRIKDSKFGWDENDVTREFVKYQPGNKVWTKNSVVESYTLKCPRLTNEVRRFFAYDILQGDEIRITDFNVDNATEHVNRYVIPSGGMKPNYVDGSNIASVEFKFDQMYQNNEHKRC
jgi:hypothetical protein